MQVLIYTVHPSNKMHVGIYMQFIPWIMKKYIRVYIGIQCTKLGRHFGLSMFLVYRRFGLSKCWFVDVFVCWRFGLSTFWSIDVSVCLHISVCRRFGLSMFLFVDILVCRYFCLSMFLFVDVLVCRRIGLLTFWLSTFRFVDVSTSYCRIDLGPPWKRVMWARFWS